MPSTPALALPYPATTETPDVPYNLQRLAERVEAVVPGASAAKAGKKLHWQVYAGAAADTLGKVTYTHTAGFTPTVVLAVSANPSTFFPMVWGVDSLTATTFTVRFALANGDAAAVSQNVPPIFALVCQ